MIWKKMQSSSLLKDGWEEVGRKGTPPVYAVQMKFLPTAPQSVAFRVVNVKTGRMVVEPWVVHRDLIQILYNGLFLLRSQKMPPVNIARKKQG
jgi:hypothetical protein